jgi:hypothetical protein
MNERPIPEPAYDDPNAVEMLRVWVAAKQLHFSMKIGMYKNRRDITEEEAWGAVLADVARTVADALVQTCDRSHDVILDRLSTRFLKELDQPTSETRGGFVSRH